MRNEHQLNGSDYLLLGFDHELRRHGFAGYSCHIILELASAIPPDQLRSRLAKLKERYPILTARPTGVLRPRWKWQAGSNGTPQIRIHRQKPSLWQDIVNEPLTSGNGDLLRFDLVERDGGRMDLVLTWAHALMDAPGAENLLALIGREDLALPRNSPAPPSQRLNFSARCKLAWKSLHHLDRICEAPPKTLGVRHQGAPCRLHHRLIKYSAEETAAVRAHGARLCGILGDAQYHAAAATVELHGLHRRLGSPTPSYVFPLPVGLRPKGSIEPLFGNQISFLMIQFLPEQLDSMAEAVKTMKAQIEQGVREGLLESGRVLGEMFRFLPLPIYMAVVKHGLKGEICSLFYGDTSSVNPQLTSFLGVPIEDFTHVGAITPSPGVGVIFYYFRGQLRVTVLNLPSILSDSEADDFASRLRNRLLNP